MNNEERKSWNKEVKIYQSYSIIKRIDTLRKTLAKYPNCGEAEKIKNQIKELELTNDR